MLDDQIKKVKIISINIEGDLHLDRVVSFILKEQPVMVMFQEVFEKDLPFLETALKMKSVFAPLAFVQSNTGFHSLGIATFSKLAFSSHRIFYYRGNSEDLPFITAKQPEKMARALLLAEIIKNDDKFFLINTHFTWSPNATPNADQQDDLQKILCELNELPEFVLAGDFNSPRGKIIFDTLSTHYQDNIPVTVTSTLDKNLHVAGHLNLVIDGFFTTSQYYVKDIKIVDGISDHCAILAEIGTGEKRTKTCSAFPQI